MNSHFREAKGIGCFEAFGRPDGDRRYSADILRCKSTRRYRLQQRLRAHHRCGRWL